MKPIAYYQNITGEKGEDPRRKDSAYWNEGKWKNFIEPLIPEDLIKEDARFFEMGASNGLFLKMAKDYGFRDVEGIEADPEAVTRGNKWKEENGYDYHLRCSEVGMDFYIDEQPLADLTLLSNVHYYFTLQDWLELLDRLYWKTEYVIIITRPFKERKDERPLSSIEAVKHYFRDWELVRARYRVRQRHMEYKGDPKPRVLHSFLFRSRLRRKRFSDLIPGAKADPIKIDRSSLVAQIKSGYDIEKTDYYKAWKDRMCPRRWTEEELFDFVGQKAMLIKDIEINGIGSPVLISADHKTIDGKHRIAISEALGYKSIICRMI